MFIGNSFKPELCSLMLAPRGSRIRLCFAKCTFYKEAQAAILHAVAARQDTEDHLLCFRLVGTYFENQNFIQLLDSNKVDTLELEDYDLGRLDLECIQALTRSHLRRLDVKPNLPRSGPIVGYMPFLNSLQFSNHLEELVLHNVGLKEEDNNCLVTILRSNPRLISFGMVNGGLPPQHWLELLSAIQMHPSLTCLNLSQCWSKYRKERTDDLSRLLSDNPRIEKLYGCHSRGYDETLFRTCVEPMLELNWYRKRVQKLRDISNTMTRGALIGRALAVLHGKPSVQYLLLSEYCNVVVKYVSERYCCGISRQGLKHPREGSRD